MENLIRPFYGQNEGYSGEKPGKCNQSSFNSVSALGQQQPVNILTAHRLVPANSGHSVISPNQTEFPSISP